MSRVEPFQTFSEVLPAAFATPGGKVTPEGRDDPLTPIQGRNIATSSTAAATAAINCP